MTEFNIVFTSDRASEVVEAESVTVEGSNGLIVLRKTVTMAGQPREVVVRRIPAAGLHAVDEIAGVADVNDLRWAWVGRMGDVRHQTARTEQPSHAR